MGHKIDPELIKKYLERIDHKSPNYEKSFQLELIPKKSIDPITTPNLEENSRRVKMGASTKGFDDYTSLRVKSIETLIASLIIHGGIDPNNLEGEALDFGTGGGEGAHVLRHYGANVVGVDTSKVGLEKAIKYNILPEERAIHEDGFNYLERKPMDSLDLIAAFRIIPGLSIQKLISESQRVLRKKGQLLVTATLDGREDLLKVQRYGKVFTGITPGAEATQFVYTKK